MREAPKELGQICVQVHPARAPGLSTPELKAAAELLAKSAPDVRGIGFSDGEDEGPYLNIIFASVDPRNSWLSIREGLLESPTFGPQLKSAAMAMCTGVDGWNDYILLYHYDPSVSHSGEA
jgi:hypothetical protein